MASYFKATVYGTHSAGDIWQFGFAVTSDLNADVIAQFIADAAATYLFSGTGCPFPEAVTLRGCRVAPFNPDDGTSSGAIDATHVQAGPLTNSLPPEVAVCVSLKTSGGPSGRFYLPPLGANQVDPNGFLDPGAQDWLRDHLESFFGSMTGNSTPILPLVYSRTLTAIAFVTTGNVGSVFDSQRRRRNKLVEARSSFPVG